jgi:hypothetical protein
MPDLDALRAAWPPSGSLEAKLNLINSMQVPGATVDIPLTAIREKLQARMSHLECYALMARTRDIRRRLQMEPVPRPVTSGVSKILDERVGTVAKIEAAIAELVRGWHELIEQSDRALVAFPNGPPPTGMALTNGELIQLLGAELFRQGATVPVTGRPQLERLPPTLPGPKSPDYMMIHQPEKITKLRVVIEQANNLARSIMEGKKDAA